MDISLLEKLLSIPKTIYLKIKVLPFSQAVKFPFFVYYKTKLVDLKGKWVFDAPLKRFMIKFGMYGAGTCLRDGSTVEIEGTIIFHWICAFGGNYQLCVTKNGLLEITNHVTFTSECHLVCNKNISIGEDTIISWGTQIMDSGLHDLIENGTRINEDKAIVIGRHCWICRFVVMLCYTKGLIFQIIQLLHKEQWLIVHWMNHAVFIQGYQSENWNQMLLGSNNFLYLHQFKFYFSYDENLSRL